MTAAPDFPALEDLPGLSEEALVRLGPCIVCDKPLFDRDHAGVTFYRVAVSRCMLDLAAVQRRAGLGMMLGGAEAIARALSPERYLARVFAGPTEVLVHENCAIDVNHLLDIIERAAKREQSTGGRDEAS